ncbi:MAG: efflux RND transporter periplasmic adaptor subunit [Acidobacteria bacterium]|nr:MAG: efflux RND transporter periplasmic adaptor subunit [Acidobacteriota bacterium]
MKNGRYLLWIGIGAALASLAAACTSTEANSTQGASPPPPRVSVIEAGAADVAIYREYAAQTYARDMVEVRGRVDGYVEKRLFQVGSDVRAGQPLYILDLRPYQAEVEKARGALAESAANLEFARRQVALAAAEADLAQAEANLLKARQDVERLRPLVKEDAASQQDLDNAIAALAANEANRNAKKANVEQTRLSTRAQIDTTAAKVEANRALQRAADLNLEYATIYAPIGGRIGDSLIQVGGLVTRNAPLPLTTIVPLDPIWVRFKISEGEYLSYFQRGSDGRGPRLEPLDLVLADNIVYPLRGRIENTVNQVDPKTGTLELQATFPNPQHTVLPGQFGRVRLRIDERKGALLVPQKAVSELQGLQSVLTVGPDNRVAARGVRTGERVQESWIVEQGLKPGDRILVEGGQKVRPGMVVDPQPYRPSSLQSEKSAGN